MTGHGLEVPAAKKGPNQPEKKESNPFSKRPGPNNILEDTLGSLLISKLPNCLPGCWAQEGQNMDMSVQAFTQTSPFGTTGTQYNVAVVSKWTLPATPVYYYIGQTGCESTFGHQDE